MNVRGQRVFLGSLLVVPIVVWAARPLLTETPSVASWVLGELRGPKDPHLNPRFAGRTSQELATRLRELVVTINEAWKFDSQVMLDAGLGVFEPLPPDGEVRTPQSEPFVCRELTRTPDGTQTVRTIRLSRDDPQYAWLWGLFDEAESLEQELLARKGRSRRGSVGTTTN